MSKTTTISTEFQTARFKGKLIFAEAINDHYTDIQVTIDAKDIDEVTCDILKNKAGVLTYRDGEGFNLGDNEAKDNCATYGDLVIDIEKIDVEIPTII